MQHAILITHLMVQSLHPAAEYHAAARAVGGCAIYVSDKPHNHNFDLLKKLVLPDGSVLRAQLPGRPTRDCLFVDPARDGKRYDFLHSVFYFYFFDCTLGVSLCSFQCCIFQLAKDLEYEQVHWRGRCIQLPRCWLV